MSVKEYAVRHALYRPEVGALLNQHADELANVNLERNDEPIKPTLLSVRNGRLWMSVEELVKYAYLRVDRLEFNGVQLTPDLFALFAAETICIITTMALHRLQIPSDPESVHDSNVVSALAHKYDDIRGKRCHHVHNVISGIYVHLMSINSIEMTMARNAWMCKESHGESEVTRHKVLHDALQMWRVFKEAMSNKQKVLGALECVKTMAAQNTNITAYGATEGEVLLDVWAYIHSRPQEQMPVMIDNMMIEMNKASVDSDGGMVCAMGRVDAALSVLDIDAESAVMSTSVKKLEVFRLAHIAATDALNAAESDARYSYNMGEQTDASIAIRDDMCRRLRDSARDLDADDIVDEACEGF
jgi:hypothetical protein